MFCRRALLVATLLSLAPRPALAIDPVAACEIAKLKTVAKQVSGSLGCGAKEQKGVSVVLKKGLSGDAATERLAALAAKLESCLDKATLKFGVAVTRSEQKAVKKGDFGCTLGPANQAVLLDTLIADLESVRDALDMPPLPDPAQEAVCVATRARLAVDAGRYTKSRLGAEATLVSKGDLGKYEAAVDRGMAKFEGAADKAEAKAQKKGVACPLPAAASVIALADAMVVNSLANVLPNSPPTDLCDAVTPNPAGGAKGEACSQNSECLGACTVFTQDCRRGTCHDCRREEREPPPGRCCTSPADCEARNVCTCRNP